jgi:hypothetical protein
MKRLLQAIAVTFVLVLATACCDVESTCAELEDGMDRSEAYDSFCNAIEFDVSAFDIEFVGPDGDSCRCDTDGSTVWDCRYTD